MTWTVILIGWRNITELGEDQDMMPSFVFQPVGGQSAV